MSARPTAAAIRPWCSACLPSVADTCVCEISFRSIGSAPMRRLSARSWASWIDPMFSIVRAVAAVDAVRVLLEVDRRQRDDLVVERDREALEEVGRLRALRAVRVDARERLAVAPALGDPLGDRARTPARPLSVNSMVTSGAFVFGSNACFGFLMSLPYSSESSSITKNRWTRADWFGAGSPSTTMMPARHLDDRRARGRAAGAERLELRQALGALGVLVRRAALRLVVGEQAPCSWCDGSYSPSISGFLSGPIG